MWRTSESGHEWSVRFASDHEDLQRFIAQAFQAKGMSAADADVVAETLVWANLRGGDGHGVARLPRYLDMIESRRHGPARPP